MAEALLEALLELERNPPEVKGSGLTPPAKGCPLTEEVDTAGLNQPLRGALPRRSLRGGHLLLRSLLRSLLSLRLLPRRGRGGRLLLRGRGLLLSRRRPLLLRLRGRSLLNRGLLLRGRSLTLRGPSRSGSATASGGTGNALDDGLAVVALVGVDFVVFAILGHADLNAERDAVELLSVLKVQNADRMAKRGELGLTDLLSSRVGVEVIDVLEDHLASLFALDDGHLKGDHFAGVVLWNLNRRLLDDDAVFTGLNRCPVAKGVDGCCIELDLSHSFGCGCLFLLFGVSQDDAA